MARSRLASNAAQADQRAFRSALAGSRVRAASLSSVASDLSGGSPKSIATLDAEISSLSGLTGGGFADGDHGDVIVSGGGTALAIDTALISTFGRTLTSASTAALARGILGLGSAALLSTAAVLQSANNLSDLASAATARTNLGLGTSAILAADTDTTLAANSDTKLATQKAVKTYVDNAVAGLLDYKGGLACAANPNYPAALKGDAYNVTTAGFVGGAAGKAVDIGDVVVATADNAGGSEAGVGASWIVLEHNLTGALVASNNLADLGNAATARTNLGLGVFATGTSAANLTGTINAAQMPALTGDVTSAAGGVALTIGANKVTRAMLAQATGATILGATAAGNVGDLTPAQAKTFLAIAESDVANLTTDLAAKAPLASPQFTGVTFYQQPAPTAKAASATLTIAELLTLIITVTSATAVALTLPTGTLTDAGILSGALAVNEAFEWYIINLGSSAGAVTLAAGTGHTIVGSATVAIATSARFLTRKTAANTFVTYRIA